jgi:hypothetical protein
MKNLFKIKMPNSKTKTMKKFLEWIKLKEKLHNINYNPPFFKEGEVWWCAVGENVSVEINGKGGGFFSSGLSF